MQNGFATIRRYTVDLPWPQVSAHRDGVPRQSFKMSAYQLGLIICVCLWGGWFWGCSEEREISQIPHLIRVGDCAADKDDFEAAFQVLAAGYSADGLTEGGKMTHLKLRVLDQLAEELLLCQHAQELNLHVSVTELDHAVEKIKAQYPPGVFEEIMLEYAVPFNVWKKRLHARLLMMKVIEAELVDELDITYDNAAQFLKDPLSGSAAGPKTKKDDKAQEQGAAALGRLRRYQSEQAYGQWLDTLKDRYKLEWNKTEIKKVIGQNADQKKLPKEIE
jgi:hypothetical protein